MGIAEASNTKALFNRADKLGVEYVLDQQFNHLEIQKAGFRVIFVDKIKFLQVEKLLEHNT
jgi:hypothetical protein